MAVIRSADTGQLGTALFAAIAQAMDDLLWIPAEAFATAERVRSGDVIIDPPNLITSDFDNSNGVQELYHILVASQADIPELATSYRYLFLHLIQQNTPDLEGLRQIWREEGADVQLVMRPYASDPSLRLTSGKVGWAEHMNYGYLIQDSSHITRLKLDAGFTGQRDDLTSQWLPTPQEGSLLYQLRSDDLVRSLSYDPLTGNNQGKITQKLLLGNSDGALFGPTGLTGDLTRVQYQYHAVGWGDSWNFSSTESLRTSAAIPGLSAALDQALQQYQLASSLDGFDVRDPATHPPTLSNALAQLQAVLLSGNDRLASSNPAGGHLAAGDGDDLLKGGSGNDWLAGENGHDTLKGAAGDDSLLGGSGNDSLAGAAGNDWLHGGLGADLLRGSGGSDTFSFSAGDASLAAADRVLDFRTAEDRLQFDFAGSGQLHLLADRFDSLDSLLLAAGEAFSQGERIVYGHTDAMGYLVADSDGDQQGDMLIILTGVRGLEQIASSDFDFITPP